MDLLTFGDKYNSGKTPDGYCGGNPCRDAVSRLLSLTGYFRAAHAHTELRTWYDRVIFGVWAVQQLPEPLVLNLPDVVFYRWQITWQDNIQ